MADDDQQDKSESPTARKLSQAREEGSVAQSQEIPTVAILAASLLVFIYSGGWIWSHLKSILAMSFRSLTTTEILPDTLLLVVTPYIWLAIKALLPFFIVLMIVGVSSYLVQFGFLVSTKAITPSLKKLNPISGIKKLFSVKSLFETIKGIAKIILVALIAYYVIKSQMQRMMGLTELDPDSIFLQFWDVSFMIVVRVMIALAILAIIDYTYQKYTYLKQQKMTKQEVKDEFKNTEGDPKVKSRIRRIQMEMAQRRMMQEVPKADVVITNPTHFAVALRYRQTIDPAPVVTAKGRGLIALKIRKEAERAGVPVIERKPLARSLYDRCRLGDQIPADLFRVVAEVLAFIFTTKSHRGTA
jgi:flagellar biosynthesis protein FlhB